MTDYNPDTHMTVHKHGFWTGVLALTMIILVCGIGWYATAGNVVYNDGKTVVTVPTLDQVKDKVVQFRDSDGHTIQTMVQPAVPAPTAQDQQITKLADAVTALQHQIDAQKQAAADQQAASAPAQATPPAAPAVQPAPVTPAPVATQPVAPAVQAPAPVVADNSGPQMNAAEAKLFVPHGFHLNDGMQQGNNLAKLNTCMAPRHLEIDRVSPKCHPAGYKDPISGLPVRTCPNKCVG